MARLKWTLYDFIRGGGDKLDLGKSSYVAVLVVLFSRLLLMSLFPASQRIFPRFHLSWGSWTPLFGGPPSDQFVWCAKTPLIHVAWCSLHHHDDDHHHHQLSLPFKKASLQGPRKACPAGGPALLLYWELVEGLFIFWTHHKFYISSLWKTL